MGRWWWSHQLDPEGGETVPDQGSSAGNRGSAAPRLPPPRLPGLSAAHPPQPHKASLSPKTLMVFHVTPSARGSRLMLLSLFLSQRTDTLALGEGNKSPVKHGVPTVPPVPAGTC